MTLALVTTREKQNTLQRKQQREWGNKTSKQVIVWLALLLGKKKENRMMYVNVLFF